MYIEFGWKFLVERPNKDEVKAGAKKIATGFQPVGSVEPKETVSEVE